MDAQQFLAEFGHIANAPGGVGRLREMVLALAVTGRLTDENPDNSAADLLQTLQGELAAYKARHGYRRSVAEPEQLFEIPFPAPNGWMPTRLGQLGSLIRGVTYNKSVARDSAQEEYVGLLRANNIGAVVSSDNLVYVPYHLVSDEQILQVGDMILAMSSGSKDLVGKAALVRTIAGHSFGGFCGVFRCMPSMSSEFIELLMRSPLYRAYVSAQGKGIGINNLTKGHIEGFQLYLPPRSAQSRIVAKVDELMALCDTLEAQQQQRRSLQNNLRQSTLQAVATATSPHELQTSWMRLADNFGQLFDAPEDVDDFIANLKNIAVRGLLSLPSQCATTVDEIVADCEVVRAQYIASGLMRRQKLVASAESEVVYPEHWAIAPFDKLAIVIGGVTKGRNLRGRKVLTCPYLSVANVQRGFFKLQGLKTIQIGAEELEKYLVKTGDLMITEGGDWDKVGRTAIWRGGVDDCLHQNHVFKARVPSKSLLNEWVELVFNSGVGRDYFAGASKQTTNLASINMTQLRSFPMPVPPLDEQHTILEKLELMTVRCIEWRRKLQEKQHLASLLSRASVASITGIAIESEKEDPVKAPQTEIIAPLRLGILPAVTDQSPLATLLSRQKGSMNAGDLFQRYGGDIDAFYAQLKLEISHGWIEAPPSDPAAEGFASVRVKEQA